MARACRLDGGSCSITTWRPRQPMSLAQFADASFAYPGTDILAGASLLIRPGDRLALLAPNGAGKSTVLRLLAGDLQLDEGDVRVLGRASVAYLRQSQELSGGGHAAGRDPGTVRRCAAAARTADRDRGAPGRRRPGRAGALRRVAGALPARGRLRAGGARQTADHGRRLRRVGPGAPGRHAVGRRARPAGAGEGAGAEAGPAAARRADQPPGPGGDRAAGGVPGRIRRRVRAGVARPRVHPRRLPRDRRAGGGQVRPLPVHLRQIRGRARRAAGTRARRVRAAEGAGRQDRRLHPPQPGRPEDQAGAEPPQDARQAGAAGASRRRMATRGEDRAVVPDRRRSGRQGDHPRAAAHGRLSGTRRRSCAT